jgi:beta-phosphoglucomutase-like phosphatase (HAD superfamily)
MQRNELQANSGANDPRNCSGIGEQLRPAYLPTSEIEFKDFIDRAYRESPFQLFHRIQESSRDLLGALRFLQFSLATAQSDAPCLQDRGQSFAELADTLKMLPYALSQLPHEEVSLKLVTQELAAISKIVDEARANPSIAVDAVRSDLANRIVMLEQGINNFFAYEPRKYRLFSLSASGAPLMVPYTRLNDLLGDPKAWIFDIDDCVIRSEHAHRQAWGLALSRWVIETQNIPNRDDAIATLQATTEFCLKHDCTDKLLSLLVVNCQQYNLTLPNLPGMVTPEVTLEAAILPFRGAVMLQFLRDGEVQFAPGALNILAQCHGSGKLLGFCTNTPRGIAEPLLREALLMQRDAGRFPHDFDALFAVEAGRVYGDTTPVRKPSPLMWLVASNGLGVRPTQTALFDNSLGNCIKASDLTAFGTSPLLGAHYGDRMLLLPEEQFAGVVGLTNGARSNLHDWHAWSGEERRPVKAVLSGFESVRHG